MAVQETTATIDDYLSAAEADPTRRIELIHGRIEEMPPSSQLNTIIAAQLARIVGNYVYGNNLGYVTGADGGYQIDEHTVYIPDVGFIMKEQAGDLSGVVFPTAPTLAVEVISPSESNPKVMTKVSDYLAAGTQVVWAVYPEAREVHIYTAGDDGDLTLRILTDEDTLTAPTILPEFSVVVGVLFPMEE